MVFIFQRPTGEESGDSETGLPPPNTNTRAVSPRSRGRGRGGHGPRRSRSPGPKGRVQGSGNGSGKITKYVKKIENCCHFCMLLFSFGKKIAKLFSFIFNLEKLQPF